MFQFLARLAVVATSLLALATHGQYCQAQSRSGQLPWRDAFENVIDEIRHDPSNYRHVRAELEQFLFPPLGTSFLVWSYDQRLTKAGFDPLVFYLDLLNDPATSDRSLRGTVMRLEFQPTIEGQLLFLRTLRDPRPVVWTTALESLRSAENKHDEKSRDYQLLPLSANAARAWLIANGAGESASFLAFHRYFSRLHELEVRRAEQRDPLFAAELAILCKNQSHTYGFLHPRPNKQPAYRPPPPPQGVSASLLEAQNKGVDEKFAAILTMRGGDPLVNQQTVLEWVEAEPRLLPAAFWYAIQLADGAAPLAPLIRRCMLEAPPDMQGVLQTVLEHCDQAEFEKRQNWQECVERLGIRSSAAQRADAFNALRALRDMPQRPEVVTALIDLLNPNQLYLRPHQAAQRDMAIGLLGELDREGRSHSALSDLMEQGAPDVALQAALALIKQSPQAAESAWECLLQQDIAFAPREPLLWQAPWWPAVQRRVDWPHATLVETLRGLEEDLIPRCRGMLASGQVGDGRRAVALLQALGTTAAIDPLVSALVHHDDQTARQASAALMAMGDSTWPALRAAAARTDQHLAFFASDLLQQMKAPSAEITNVPLTARTAPAAPSAGPGVDAATQVWRPLDVPTLMASLREGQVPRVLVLDFAASPDVDSSAGSKLASLLSAHLTSEPLELVEREALAAVEQELALRAGGLVDPQTLACSQLLGADLMVSGRFDRTRKAQILVAQVMGTQTRQLAGVAVRGILEDDLADLALRMNDQVAELLRRRQAELAPAIASLEHRTTRWRTRHPRAHIPAHVTVHVRIAGERGAPAEAADVVAQHLQACVRELQPDVPALTAAPAELVLTLQVKQVRVYRQRHRMTCSAALQSAPQGSYPAAAREPMAIEQTRWGVEPSELAVQAMAQAAETALLQWLATASDKSQ